MCHFKEDVPLWFTLPWSHVLHLDVAFVTQDRWLKEHTHIYRERERQSVKTWAVHQLKSIFIQID